MELEPGWPAFGAETRAGFQSSKGCLGPAVICLYPRLLFICFFIWQTFIESLPNATHVLPCSLGACYLKWAPLGAPALLSPTARLPTKLAVAFHLAGWL